MEGISIGEENGAWLVGFNREVYSRDQVTGWCYSLYPYEYYQWNTDMCLLDNEKLLASKCLIKW